ncbi:MULTISPECIES: bifunctional [glutamine synthetase] adenylyltransferase/[glutamine synthetase]-adenylyl-L-tyrosine phosphorylase [unclassified Chelatococcus]|uniref:bifunctional [glutamine synthetase] adenylyltransferase/[glutamine synthetase]-adenylyl-L-tyrosine phosphorylase n=1 Tax=unclassified Chelatococcus TaxID=2638111 RepID=UPI001BCB57DB|nr:MULTISPECIES: bifunctional [glutamine synthetase] adenylyltransferase/[glutamine synthetase]-adenylyl-L-tyrosine phosphorylase [unclassified Chelatococcus]CAH1669698.1 Glutamine synthetase adenylyl-L-tyrosine phosphorylase / Glutamine synthetase adenylyl transferase [Hyphomicrobiales bacterium]MBS7739300.1 bifunctional [glutamine synthetase] adenylyltransferase/[glutamine synthetase]-adenylyl-L-tyrosine phosphorylase [Chelatococcus sp. HY11]MBX3546579.1 bifunctional [glutamine synthetase] ade
MAKRGQSGETAEGLAAMLAPGRIPFDAEAAGRRLDDLIADVARHVPSLQLAERLTQWPSARDMLLALADHSSFLWSLATADPARLLGLLNDDPETRRQRILAEVSTCWQDAEDQAALMKRLRHLRGEHALLVALADCGGLWPLELTTGALTDFADAAVGTAVRFLLKEATVAGRFAPVDPQHPEKDCGVVILALGKHGAGELNYSSDIDLVVFYDPDNVPVAGRAEPPSFAIKLAQGLVKLLQERTGDGYVFRVDLRLRPDPGSTAVAVSLPSAFTYYETVGQNWERAAFIKARAIAGDIARGERFLADLTPFIWRKYFDFAAIADIHAMKRQIHAARGHEAIAVAGHDIKLGRGGIREIEFFVQTQQLVFGGRRPALRGRRTLEMLDALVTEGWITAQARDDLAAAYRFLRMVEHRLQMVADEQTQRLPREAGDLNDFARFCGFQDEAAFADALTHEAQAVQKHYALLFEEAPELASDVGSLVFTGTSDDPETLETLRALGFQDPSRVAETIRGWHFGRRPAVRTARAREVLTELTPALLTALGRSADPDAALAALDQAFGHMLAAVELLSMLRSSERLLTLFADLLGSAPRLADVVASSPHVLDAVIDPAFLDPTRSEESTEARLRGLVGEAASFEDFLDRIRGAARQENFLVGAQFLTGILSPKAVGEAYSAVAQAVVRLCLSAVETEFAAQHGRVPGGRAAVFGFGRLGSREMTATSDLDLVVLYDFDQDNSRSDGERPLEALVYYTRLTQRLVSALTVPTRRGRLFEVDMRLRPSGNKGPVATQFRSFLAYHADGEAETWERMALTRARPIAGDPGLAEDAAAAMQSILRTKRDAAAVAHDVASMRHLIATEKGDTGPWDLKMAPGGMVDLEFIAQYLVLAYAHANPAISGLVGTGEVLAFAARNGLVAPEQGEDLRASYVLLSDVFQWQRLTVDGPFDVKAVAPSVVKRIATAIGVPDVKVLASDLKDTRSRVRHSFEQVIGPIGKVARKT